MKQTVTDRVLLALAVIATILMCAYLVSLRPYEAFGSVSQSDEYLATTTYPAQASANAVRTIRSGFGSLGSVVVTGPNSGVLQIYDATTSDVTLRAASMGSTTILLAEIPSQGLASSTNTYTFDVQFTRGLLIVTSANVPTTTVTYR